jgi:presenilin-like A22 family membrane protease
MKKSRKFRLLFYLTVGLIFRVWGIMVASTERFTFSDYISFITLGLMLGAFIEVFLSFKSEKVGTKSDNKEIAQDAADIEQDRIDDIV